MPNRTTRKRQEYFGPSQLLRGVRAPYWVRVVNADEWFSGGDLLLVDCKRRPHVGDHIITGTLATGLTVGVYESGVQDVFGTIVTLIRQLPVRKLRAASDPTQKLREQLDRLERLPENEGERFKLESEIFKLDHARDEDEWPDVIGGGGDE